MSDVFKYARVILRPDGSVHIVLRDRNTLYATPQNLQELFSNPINFILHTCNTYKTSTYEANHGRYTIDDVLGLTLAYINSDKQIICDFPELFAYVFSKIEDKNEKTIPVNMNDLKYDNVLSDEKAYLLRYYLEFTSSLKPEITIKHNLKLRQAVQYEIIREALNIFFEDEMPRQSDSPRLNEQIGVVESKTVFQKDTENINWVTLKQYAEAHGLTYATIRSYALKGLLKSAKKNEKGITVVDSNEIPEAWDGRKKAKYKTTLGKDNYRIVSGSSAADIQDSIARRELFTQAVAPFIRTFEELKYYEYNRYHEVNWDGRPALIIDVNPEYVSEETGISNRDLMKEGKAPVVPNRAKEKYHFHIHHVGQLPNSPFAIIPEYDHNSKNLSPYLHQSNSGKELHGPEFEMQKKRFWRKYLEEYDKVPSYLDIPYLNPILRKHKQKAKYKK